MSSKNSPAVKEDYYEKEFSNFLIKKISNNGGSFSLQPLTGHFSQLRPEVRSYIGATVADLKFFLSKHKNLFSVQNDVVSLIVSPTNNYNSYDSDSSSVGAQSNLPERIKEGKGVIIKLFSDFGIIKSKEPVKHDVFFRAWAFGDQNIDLTSCKFIYCGAVVYFNAKKERNEKFKSKYIATKVWRADESNSEDGKLVLKSRKHRDTGLYDPLTLDDEGIIQNVFPNLGFIAVKGDEHNTVFFYKSRLANYANVVDLTRVLARGDVVEFNAHRSTKPNAKARWEAIKVWKKSEKANEHVCKSDGSTEHSSSKHFEKKPVIQSKDMKRNQKGKICPRSKGVVIKFGDNELADGDSALYYICGTQVHDISWEFDEGDNVIFDAVRIKSAPGWKASLVWTGDKPDIDVTNYGGDLSELTDEENEASSSFYTSKSSSCLSLNSNSSMKSMSVKSESVNSKNGENTSGKSLKLHNKHVMKSNDCMKKLKTPKSEHTQQNNLRSSVVSNNRLVKNKEPKGGILSSDVAINAGSSWAERAYPDDDNNDAENHEEFDSPAYNSECEKTIHNYLDEEFSEKPENTFTKQNNEGECSQTNTKEFSESDIDINEPNENELKIPKIKLLQNVKGKIIKVYSKFAEVKSSDSQSTVSFVWNDFYSDGVSVKELELDDLKQILKVGDIVNLNYFIIVDDSNVTWQKVSLAWQGRKPKVPFEMSPSDFIKQNDLSVTVGEEEVVDSRLKNEVTPEESITAASKDTSHQNDEVCLAESFPENNVPTISTNIARQNITAETVFLLDAKDVKSTVCEILRKAMPPSTVAEVKISSVAEEIIQLVLTHSNGHNNDSCNVSQTSERITEKFSCSSKDAEKTCINMLSQQNTSLNDCGVQTIITGEIIACNIFTEC